MNVGSASTPRIEGVYQPTDVTATAAYSSEIDLGWTAPVQPVDNIKVLRSTTGTDGVFSQISPSSFTSDSIIDTDVVSGQEYDYEVFADYNGASSDPIVVYATPTDAFTVTVPSSVTTAEVGTDVSIHLPVSDGPDGVSISSVDINWGDGNGDDIDPQYTAKKERSWSATISSILSGITGQLCQLTNQTVGNPRPRLKLTLQRLPALAQQL